MRQYLCSNLIRPARNGKSRGICTRQRGHSSKCFSKIKTCSHCGIIITKRNACPSVLAGATGLICLSCIRQREYSNGRKPRNTQTFGAFHTFLCGCSGILPTAGCKSNKLALMSHRGSATCRVMRIIISSRWAAKVKKHIPILASHSVIRKLMKEKACWRCRKLIVWKFGRGETPHLHHDHQTGEVYGFTHSRCNPNALEDEIDELRKEIKFLTISLDKFSRL